MKKNIYGERKRSAKIDPGLRFFKCKECSHEWIEKSIDCSNRKASFCPNRYHGDIHVIGAVNPHEFERHPEWSLDRFGNLI